MNFFLLYVTLVSPHKIWSISIFLCRPGVNFTNILQAAFMHADPKSAIKLLNLTVFFALLGSARIKAAHRTLVKMTPTVNFFFSSPSEMKKWNFNFNNPFCLLASAGQPDDVPSMNPCCCCCHFNFFRNFGKKASKSDDITFNTFSSPCHHRLAGYAKFVTCKNPIL